MNLISNALDAMRQTPPGQRKVEISTAGNGENEVRLSVRDHGTGIRYEVHERLFDQFFTTKERGWEWDWQLCAPSWNLMAVRSGRRMSPMAARVSILLYR